VTGEQVGQSRIRANISRQNAEQNHLATDDIVAAYEPQIAALSHPRRTMSSPD
jgi:hypothetical protein